MNTIQQSLAALAIGLSVASSGSLAADDNAFLGPSIGIGISNVRAQTDFGGVQNGSIAKSNTGILLEANYGFPVFDNFIGTVGANVDVKSDKLGETNIGNNGTSGTLTGKLAQHWSLYLAPGYVVAPQWLLYAKLGYDQTNLQTNNSLMTDNVSDSAHGWSYGLGADYAFMPNFEARLEYVEARFSKQQSYGSRLGGAWTTSNPRTSTTSLIFAYRF